MTAQTVAFLAVAYFIIGVLAVILFFVALRGAARLSDSRRVIVFAGVVFVVVIVSEVLLLWHSPFLS